MRLNGKRLLVGQIAQLAGVKSDTLRFYERAGLMPKTERTAGGYRAYGPDAVERLHFIRKAQALGFSLDQVKCILRLRQSRSLPCDYVIELAEQRLKEADQELRRLEQFRAALERYVHHWKRTASFLTRERITDAEDPAYNRNCSVLNKMKASATTSLNTLFVRVR